MKEIIVEILRDTGEFEEKNIDDSATFVSDYVTKMMQAIHDMPDYSVINKELLKGKS